MFQIAVQIFSVLHTRLGSLVIIGALRAAVGNILLPTAPVPIPELCEAFAGGSILAPVAQGMLPRAYEEGADVVSLSTIGGFTVACFLASPDTLPHDP